MINDWGYLYNRAFPTTNASCYFIQSYHRQGYHRLTLLYHRLEQGYHRHA